MKKSKLLLFILLCATLVVVPVVAESTATTVNETVQETTQASVSEEMNTEEELTEEKAEEETEEIIELGISRVLFRFQLIDDAMDDKVQEPVVYLDLSYDLRAEDKSVQNALNLAEELLCLTIVRGDKDEFSGLSCISYETNPITEYPERLNTEDFSWKVFVNGEESSMDYEIKDGDMVQIVYTSLNEVPEANDEIANRYFFVQNNTVSFNFTMDIKADAETMLAEGEYQLYIDKKSTDDIQVAQLVEAVCQHHELEYYFDGNSVHIGDYIAEQDAEGNYHFWALVDEATGFGCSLGLGGEWGLSAGSGMHYTIMYK